MGSKGTVASTAGMAVLLQEASVTPSCVAHAEPMATHQ
jgi:hypothetical protein